MDFPRAGAAIEQSQASRFHQFVVDRTRLYLGACAIPFDDHVDIGSQALVRRLWEQTATLVTEDLTTWEYVSTVL
jgi:hypothetical protein